MSSVWQRHRGPYSLFGLRPAGRRSEAGVEHVPLFRNVEAKDVEDMARMVLTDPRDNIKAVYVWSEREEQYVTAFRLARRVASVTH